MQESYNNMLNNQENIDHSEMINHTQNSSDLFGMTDLIKTELSSYYNFISEMRELANSCRNVGLQRGPSSLINIPEADADDEELLDWAKSCIMDLRRETVKLNKQLDWKFGKGSESIRKSERFVEKLKKKETKNNSNVITRSEYKESKEKYTNILGKYTNKLKILMAENSDNTKKMDKLTGFIKIIKEMLENLDKKTIIDDPEPDDNSNNDDNSNHDDGNHDDNNDSDVNKKNNDNDSKKSEQSDDDQKEGSNNNQDTEGSSKIDSNDKNNNSNKDFLSEHGDEINAENKKIDDNIDKAKKEENNAKRKGITVGSEGDITIKPGTKIEPKRTYTQEDINDLNREIGRSVEVYAQNTQLLVDTIAKVIPASDEHGNKYEIHPATATNLVLKQDGKVIGIADKPILNPLSAEEQEELDKLAHSWRYNLAPIYPLLDYIDGQIVIAPLEMYGNAGIIFGARPIFPKYRISEGAAINILCTFLILNTSKSKVAKLISFKSPVYRTRQDVTRLINIMAILLHGTVVYNKKIVLKSCRTLHCDETPLICLKLRNQKENDKEVKREKCYIWCFVTGKHEKAKGVIYYPAKTRKIEEFLQGLGCTKNDDGTYKITELAIENLIADCYQVYPSAKNILEDGLTRKINLSGCYAHLRRKFVDALKQLELWNIFKQALKGDVKNFWDRFNELLNKMGRTLSTEVYKVVEATFILELILSLDRDFPYLTKDEVDERRQRLSLPLLDIFYSCIYFIYENTNYIEPDKMSDGVQKYKGDNVAPYVSAIVYALNNMKYFYNALKDGDVDLTNNLCEQFLRSIACQRQVMEFLFSEYGFQCYADLKTLEAMCEINGVNIFVYLAWVIANKKLRLENYVKELNEKKILTDEEISHKEIINIVLTEKDENGKRVSIPSEKIQSAFALVSDVGLDVNSFKRLCDKEMARVNENFKKLKKF